jgi:hypothetical protein
VITLIRGADTIDLTPLLWDACQVFAKQAGWQPAGAIDKRDRNIVHSVYAPGRVVAKTDAWAFATALERVINGEAGDSGELDLGALAALVNFLRGGAFLIN